MPSSLSALLSDLVKLARYEEGADALVAWLGDAAKPTEQERAVFEAERCAPLSPARPR